MTRGDEVNRRTVLKKSTLAGSLSFLGAIGPVEAATSSEVDIDSVLESNEVERIERKVPDLAVERDEAVTFGRESSTVRIPANYGVLVVVDGDDDRMAMLHFDEHVPELDADWPAGTEGRLRSTENGTVFERSTTESEARSYLRAIGRSDLIGDDTVYVNTTPEEGEFGVTHVNQDENEVEILQATVDAGRSRKHRPSRRSSVRRPRIRAHDAGASSQRETVTSARVIEKEVYSGTGENEMSAQSRGCRNCDTVAADAIMCIQTVGTCGLCFYSAAAPPVLVACVVVVCIGGPGGVLSSFFADIGCHNLGECVNECYLKEWEGLY